MDFVYRGLTAVLERHTVTEAEVVDKNAFARGSKDSVHTDLLEKFHSCLLI